MNCYPIKDVAEELNVSRNKLEKAIKAEQGKLNKEGVKKTLYIPGKRGRGNGAQVSGQGRDWCKKWAKENSKRPVQKKEKALTLIEAGIIPDSISYHDHKQFGLIRKVLINGESWVVGVDAAKALGYSNARDALNRHVENKYKKDNVVIPDATNRNRLKTVINEPGFYSLIMNSELPMAKEFQDWAYSEVFPEIARTGSYNRNSNSLSLEQTLTAIAQPFMEQITLLTNASIQAINKVAGERDTAIAQKDEAISERDEAYLDRDVIDMENEDLREGLSRSDQIIQYLDRFIDKILPKAQMFDDLTGDKETLYEVTEIADGYDGLYDGKPMTRNRINSLLEQIHFQYKTIDPKTGNYIWHLNKQYKGQGYAVTKPFPWANGKGKSKQMRFTRKGVLKIIELLGTNFGYWPSYLTDHSTQIKFEIDPDNNKED